MHTIYLPKYEVHFTDSSRCMISVDSFRLDPMTAMTSRSTDQQPTSDRAVKSLAYESPHLP